ncbi:MAG: 5-formyltetrahydrofolate cyclo-ligase [Bacteroidetes bacterium HGW-Bacteroidetes-15]|nr:MAG: 5-formyltetrahydrofolate cyclo-ligase [Bacteroidetes bacterium HGW-Bacteroidetes-15]
MSKQLLRQEIRELKKKADKQRMLSASQKIFHQVEELTEFKSAKTILAYWSLPDEVQTHDFVMKWYREKQILLPIVAGEMLEIREFSGMECMEPGSSFGILEPKKGKAVNNINIDLVIVPGVAFDLQGNRLGRGKGYYDKLLKNKDTYKVGVCFDFQLVDKVPVDSFDISMNIVVQSI